jgi:hypothetical protein
MLLDDFLPAYEFREFHSIAIDASPERVFAALRELSTADLSPLIYLMLALRGLPAWLLGKKPSMSFRHGPFLERLYMGGFLPLAEDPGGEIVFGLVGQFWMLTGGLATGVTNAATFLAFDDPAFTRAAINLRVHVDARGRTRCSTETRIQASDPATRRKFARYWRIILPGSAFIRVLWLRAIKHKAEA